MKKLTQKEIEELMYEDVESNAVNRKEKKKKKKMRNHIYIKESE